MISVPFYVCLSISDLLGIFYRAIILFYLLQALLFYLLIIFTLLLLYLFLFLYLSSSITLLLYPPFSFPLPAPLIPLSTHATVHSPLTFNRQAFKHYSSGCWGPAVEHNHNTTRQDTTRNAPNCTPPLHYSPYPCYLVFRYQ